VVTDPKKRPSTPVLRLLTVGRRSCAELLRLGERLVLPPSPLAATHLEPARLSGRGALGLALRIR